MFEKLKKIIKEHRQTLDEVRKKNAEHELEKKAKQTYFNIAHEYNKAHCWAGYRYTPESPTWMCPTCNKVHSYVDTQRDKDMWFLCGPIYPACCEFTIGHRAWDECAATEPHEWLWQIIRARNAQNRKWDIVFSKDYVPFSWDTIDRRSYLQKEFDRLKERYDAGMSREEFEEEVKHLLGIGAEVNET